MIDPAKVQTYWFQQELNCFPQKDWAFKVTNFDSIVSCLIKLSDPPLGTLSPLSEKIALHKNPTWAGQAYAHSWGTMLVLNVEVYDFFNYEIPRISCAFEGLRTSFLRVKVEKKSCWMEKRHADPKCMYMEASSIEIKRIHIGCRQIVEWSLMLWCVLDKWWDCASSPQLVPLKFGEIGKWQARLERRDWHSPRNVPLQYH